MSQLSLLTYRTSLCTSHVPPVSFLKLAMFFNKMVYFSSNQLFFTKNNGDNLTIAKAYMPIHLAIFRNTLLQPPESHFIIPTLKNLFFTVPYIPKELSYQHGSFVDWNNEKNDFHSGDSHF